MQNEQMNDQLAMPNSSIEEMLQEK